MRIAICQPQWPFARGGGELHAERMRDALREAGHEADIVGVPFKWYPPSELVHQMGMWRSVDLSESNGEPIDMVIALKFPAYLVRHERKVVWLIHQHRPAYDLWDHPQFGDLVIHEDGAAVRDMIWQADQVALKEATRLFTNSDNVRQRLRRFLGMSADVLYHRSPMCEQLLAGEHADPGDFVLFPSRFDPLKRQALAIDAMREVRSDVRLVLVGRGATETELRERIASAGLEDRVLIEVGVSDERLMELYGSALAVYYGPWDEDYGYVTIEGMAAGRPVVVTADSGGPLELVRAGENGFVVEPDPASIASVLDDLYADRGTAAKLGAAGRDTVLDSVPDWPEVVSRLVG